MTTYLAIGLFLATIVAAVLIVDHEPSISEEEKAHQKEVVRQTVENVRKQTELDILIRTSEIDKSQLEYLERRLLSATSPGEVALATENLRDARAVVRENEKRMEALRK